LVRVKDGKVVLRVVATGQEHAQPLAKLSKADQEFATSTYRLITSLRNRNPDTRDQAVDQLVDIGLDAVPALIEEMNHKNGGKGSIEALGKIGAPAIPHLLRHGERVWREQQSRRNYPLNQLLVQLLLAMPAQDVLAAVQRQKKEEIRVAFVHMLSIPDGHMDEQRLDLVAGMVDDPSVPVLRTVFDFLFIWGAGSTRPAVLDAYRRELTKAGDPGLQVLAARGLCVLKQTGRLSAVLVPPDDARDRDLVLDTIEDVFTKSHDLDAWSAAARLFGDLAVDKAMVPRLKKLLASRAVISTAAAKQLANLGPDAVDAVPDLIKVLQAPKVAQAKVVGRRPRPQTQQSRQRVAAVHALGAIGLAQPDVVDTLLAAAGASDQYVCSEIIIAFRDADLVPHARNRLTEAIMGNTELDDKSKQKLCKYIKTIK
jgi:hypothetical protein